MYACRDVLVHTSFMEARGILGPGVGGIDACDPSDLNVENQTQVLWRNSHCSSLLSQLPSAQNARPGLPL